MDGDDVRVREPRHRLRLAHEARARSRVEPATRGADSLSATLAVELRIVRGVDDAHAAGAEELRDE